MSVTSFLFIGVFVFPVLAAYKDPGYVLGVTVGTISALVIIRFFELFHVYRIAEDYNIEIDRMQRMRTIRSKRLEKPAPPKDSSSEIKELKRRVEELEEVESLKERVRELESKSSGIEQIGSDVKELGPSEKPSKSKRLRRRR